MFTNHLNRLLDHGKFQDSPNVVFGVKMPYAQRLVPVHEVKVFSSKVYFINMYEKFYIIVVQITEQSALKPVYSFQDHQRHSVLLVLQRKKWFDLFYFLLCKI